MKQQTQVKLPSTVPGMLEIERNGYIRSDNATVAQWREYKRLMESDMTHWAAVNQMIRIANRLHLPDDVPLLPRLLALASANVVSVLGAKKRDQTV